MHILHTVFIWMPEIDYETSPATNNVDLLMDSIQLGVQRALSTGDLNEIMETVEEDFMSKAMTPITTNGVTGLDLQGFNFDMQPYLFVNFTEGYQNEIVKVNITTEQDAQNDNIMSMLTTDIRKKRDVAQVQSSSTWGSYFGQKTDQNGQSHAQQPAKFENYVDYTKFRKSEQKYNPEKQNTDNSALRGHEFDYGSNGDTNKAYQSTSETHSIGHVGTGEEICGFSCHETRFKTDYNWQQRDLLPPNTIYDDWTWKLSTNGMINGIPMHGMFFEPEILNSTIDLDVNFEVHQGTSRFYEEIADMKLDIGGQNILNVPEFHYKKESILEVTNESWSSNGYEFVGNNEHMHVLMQSQGSQDGLEANFDLIEHWEENYKYNFTGSLTGKVNAFPAYRMFGWSDEEARKPFQMKMECISDCTSAELSETEKFEEKCFYWVEYYHRYSEFDWIKYDIEDDNSGCFAHYFQGYNFSFVDKYVMNWETEDIIRDGWNAEKDVLIKRFAEVFNSFSLAEKVIKTQVQETTVR